MRLRVLTFNLMGVRHGWFEERRTATLAGLKGCRPDVVCFQEATILRHQTSEHLSFYHQAKELGSSISLNHVAFTPYGNPIKEITDDEGGIAIVAKFPIVEVRSRQLVPGPDEKGDARVALFLSFETKSGNFHIINAHLSWRPEEAATRFAQMKVIQEELARCRLADRSVRAILCGDLNATEDEPSILGLRDFLHDSYRIMHPEVKGFTWESRNPLTAHSNLADRRVDYILCTKEAKILSSEIVLDQAAPVFPSDHFGVLTELEWEGI